MKERTKELFALIIGLRLALYAALSPHGLTFGMCQWDCHWYVATAVEGYDRLPRSVDGQPQANWAFFPLLPLLMRAVAALSGLEPALVGVLVSTLAFWAFAIVGWRLRLRTRPAPSASAWLLLLIAWPWTLYFSAPYAESLYAALAVASLLALAEARRTAAATWCALLTATRPTGIVLAAWIGLSALWAARRPGAFVAALSTGLLACAGLLAYAGFLWWRVGDPLAFAHVQLAWGNRPGAPLAFLRLAATRLAAGRPGIAYEAAWALAGLAVAGWHARRHPAEAWLLGGTVLMALAAGAEGSMARFVGANPAFLLALADRLDRAGRAVRVAVLLACGSLQVVFLLAWFRGATWLQ